MLEKWLKIYLKANFHQSLELQKFWTERDKEEKKLGAELINILAFEENTKLK